MNLSHTDLTNLTEASRFALAAIRLETFGKADRLRELLSMQSYFVRSVRFLRETKTYYLNI